MKIYIFGNPDYAGDEVAFVAAKKLEQQPGLEFEYVKPNQDVPFVGQDYVIIMDAVLGLKEARLFTDPDLEKIILPPRTSAHDFDLNFQIKYLKKIGKLGDVFLIGLPMESEIDYDSIHSIVKKLVAQDIQGS